MQKLRAQRYTRLQTSSLCEGLRALCPQKGITIPAFVSLPALLQSRKDDPGLAQRVKRFGLWQRVTWAEHVGKVNALAAYLVDQGLKKGEKVAVLSENRPEWLVSDLAVQSVGGVSVGVYTTSSPKQVKVRPRAFRRGGD